jgi:hypothetical protein
MCCLILRRSSNIRVTKVIPENSITPRSTPRPIFQRYFTNHNIKGDASEPYFEGKDSHMIQETKEAYDALLEAGFLDTHYDADDDGLRLPEIILRAQWPNLTPKILGGYYYIR